MRCKICGSERQHSSYQVREMMFGMPESFGYFQCIECRCLQIEAFPQDMAPYYPANYYSYAPRITQGNLLGRLQSHMLLTPLHQFWPDTKTARIHDWLRRAGTRHGSSILDVGCGSGDLLCRLASYGFRSLHGIDPFVAQDTAYPNGVSIRKMSALELRGENFDLIMMHHSLEHMPNPGEVLNHLATLLNENGVLLIRIPTVDSDAWEHYGENWFQLDAPRHFFLHSRKSMEFLARGAGLTVFKTQYDSRASQFWASEQYRAGIPHRSPQSFEETGKSDLFDAAQLRHWEAESRRLNAGNRGDAMALFLRRIPA